MQAHLKCKLRLLALALVTSLRDVTLNVENFNQENIILMISVSKIALGTHLYYG
jgi:hypothetical protein